MLSDRVRVTGSKTTGLGRVMGQKSWPVPSLCQIHHTQLNGHFLRDSGLASCLCDPDVVQIIHLVDLLHTSSTDWLRENGPCCLYIGCPTPMSHVCVFVHVGNPNTFSCSTGVFGSTSGLNDVPMCQKMSCTLSCPGPHVAVYDVERHCRLVTSSLHRTFIDEFDPQSNYSGCILCSLMWIMLQKEQMEVGQQYACMLYTWRSCSMAIGQVNCFFVIVYSVHFRKFVNWSSASSSAYLSRNEPVCSTIRLQTCKRLPEKHMYNSMNWLPKPITRLWIMEKQRKGNEQ